VRIRPEHVVLSLAMFAALLSAGCTQGPAGAAAPADAPPAAEAPAAAPAAPPAAEPASLQPAQPAKAPATSARLLAVPDVGKSAVKADGVLDEAVWKKAATSEAFGHDDGTKGGARTKLLVARGDGNVYIAVEGFDEAANLKNPTAFVTEHDGSGIWEDDDVELFIGPAGDRNSYYQIIINPKGVTWDSYFSSARDGDLQWSPKYASGVKIGKESWVAEFVLPVAIFDESDKMQSTWDFNVLRMRAATGESLYWSPVGGGGSSHTPTKFGKLSGMPAKK